MLTPQEITDKRFDKVLMGGYDMGAVDAFLDTVEKDYAQIYKENIVLKNKMKVLVAKIEEYRSVDESMRKALLSAQSMASQIIDKAKAESVNIEQAASAKADSLVSNYRERIAAEEMKLEEAKTEVQAFVERMLGMYAKETEYLKSVREQEFSGSPDEIIPPAAPVYQPTPAAKTQPTSTPAPTPAPRPVTQAPKPVPTPVPQPVRQETATQEAPRRSVLPDTVTLPNLPPIPEDPHAQRAAKPEQEAPAPVKRPASYENDDGETILLTPKPRFQFNDLQFGEKYNNSSNANKKKQ